MIVQLSIIGLLLITPSVFTQFDMGGVVPDVKFDADNDRYDITSMIHDTNRMFRQNAIAPDDDEDARRNFKSEEDVNTVGQLAEDKPRYVPISTRRFMKIRRRFIEKNIKKFMTTANETDKRRLENVINHLHGNVSLRRNNSQVETTTGHSKDDQVLMNYAMPIVMNIDGYLKVPSE